MKEETPRIPFSLKKTFYFNKKIYQLEMIVCHDVLLEINIICSPYSDLNHVIGFQNEKIA